MNIYSRIKLPQMRQMLIFSLKDLSNLEYQKKTWVLENNKMFFWDNFELILEFLYDDLVIYDRPEDGIGYVVVNEQENTILRPLYKALDAVCEEIGENKPDSFYINSPLWHKVIESAQQALEVFMANEQAAQKNNPQPWKGEDNWEVSLPD